MLLPPSLTTKTITLGTETLPETAEYRMFEPWETGFAKRSYVFAALANHHIASDDSISKAIRKEEGVRFNEANFFYLTTHRTRVSVPCGFYTLEWLGYSEISQPSGQPCEPYVDEWRHCECPETVFNAFVHLIGDFPTIEQVVSRDSKEYPAYRDMPAEKLEGELGFCREEVARYAGYARESRARYHGKFLTPEQARRRGYCFTLACRSYLADSSWFEHGCDGVPVDLGESHLLGQICPRGTSLDVAKGQLSVPKPFALWRPYPQTLE